MELKCKFNTRPQEKLEVTSGPVKGKGKHEGKRQRLGMKFPGEGKGFVPVRKNSAWSCFFSLKMSWASKIKVSLDGQDRVRSW